MLKKPQRIRIEFYILDVPTDTLYAAALPSDGVFIFEEEIVLTELEMKLVEKK